MAQTGVRNPNARSAMKQAQFVADNIVLAIRGREPTCRYSPDWADSVIKLTLGLVSEFLFATFLCSLILPD